MQTILVTGGCGYIGAHTIVDLIENGFNVISVDNLSRSSENSLAGIEKITGKKVKNYNIDLTNAQAYYYLVTDIINLSKDEFFKLASFRKLVEASLV